MWKPRCFEWALRGPKADTQFRVALLALAISTLVPATIATIAAIAATTTVSIVGAGRESAIVEVLDERTHNVDMAEFGGSSFPHVDVLTEEHTEVVW
jgi:hypothetical protein